MNLGALNSCTFNTFRLKGFKSIPNEKGIYIVMVPKSFNVRFLESTTAIDVFHGRCLLYPACVLETKYNHTDKRILYVGKAGGEKNKLRQRIKQYVNYGYGEASNHRGGRAIWQIENNQRLLIGFHICEDPREKEKRLLSDYFNLYGTFPVANWRA